MISKHTLIELEENIYIVDKPSDVSSNFFLQKIKREYGFTKIGHAGTLDPFATGILLIGVNKGTKKLASYVGYDKRYTVRVCNGVSTDTGDRTGEVQKEETLTRSVQEELKKTLPKVLSSLVGEHNLPVPSFSAKKISGKKLYELARRGKEVPTLYHTAKVYEIVFLGVTETETSLYLDFECAVGSGTYIRSLSTFIGEKIDLPTHVVELRRTQVGHFSL